LQQPDGGMTNGKRNRNRNRRSSSGDEAKNPLETSFLLAASHQD